MTPGNDSGASPRRPRRPAPRTDYTPAEARAGIGWLSAAALMSALVEIGSLASLHGIPAIAAALFFGVVVTKTALLWTSIRAVALIPAAAWLAGYTLFGYLVDVTATLAAANKIPALLLLAAGCLGGMWPISKPK